MPQAEKVVTTPILKVIIDREKAFGCKEGEKKGLVWLPKSQILEPEVETIRQGDEIEMTVPEWLAREKGWA